jgi:hypothetical protein
MPSGVGRNVPVKKRPNQVPHETLEDIGSNRHQKRQLRRYT